AMQVVGGKPEQFEQILLAKLLPAQVFGGVSCGNQRILRGIPGFVVYSVEDANDAIGAAANDAVETVTEFGGLDLLGVAPADGGEVVGVNQPAFEQVDVAEKLQSAGMEEYVGDSGAGQRVATERALITHIVNREDHRQVLHHDIVAIRRAEQNRK